jgi:peptidoglycan/LPS O-acetylase OafA/YrhL
MKIQTNLAQTQSFLLNLIRYLLATVVVVGHGFGIFLGSFNDFFPQVFPHLQSIAVVCFFYLSGFLIVGSQLSEDAFVKDSLSNYLFNRTSRVYVTLVPSIIFVLLADMYFSKFGATKIDLNTSNTAIQTLFKNLLLMPSTPYGTMRPIWSLMYEWWIYLLFGGIFFLRSNKFLGCLLILVGAHFTFNVNASGEAGHIWIIWALGGVCARLQRIVLWSEFSSHKFFLSTLVLLLAAVYFYLTSKNAYDLQAGVCLALSIFIFSNMRISTTTAQSWHSVVNKLAGYSFTLFLTHYTVLTYSKEYLNLNGWLGLFWGFALSNCIAFLIAVFTEYRIASIKSLASKIALTRVIPMRKS